MFEREENNFIPGIFNYCDRWCERCPLTARCSVYAMVEDEQQADEYAGGDSGSVLAQSAKHFH